MKKIFLMMMASTALMACSPTDTKTTTSTTTTEETTTAVASDTTTEVASDTSTETVTSTDSSTTMTEDMASDATVSGTMANDDNANVADEVDMAAGDGIEGKVESWDATGRTFTMMEGDKSYTVIVNDNTQYMDGDQAWDVDGFYGEDRMGQDIAVEGEIDSATNTITATKITRY
ncbi:hypothetical protein Deipr_2093 (plasmid) [Deinococcus proteolyticus MRP]|uniref:DUF5666 domain-containing protein n=1 Tax=Deinococcus proteolyticus (strain ATCC 35074 / DSM 20540 / JCM 6276 / NBRC 101906 / NCIMB 13154 / VKM Ac-1939 / CCM 2703 / MRP) TaxID=693977 RepID=F0RQ21_DEIPM|nr:MULTISPECIES: hypothetical protein [Deinococcus]ADY27223.1 hypothetical protein Deipr_2093 [Deinococcus proteolyticus MRP]MCY1704093.1 hypothetical protein [Deinococcus sp. SL84]